MTRKDYEAAALIAQRYAPDSYQVIEAFCDLFRDDNARFDEPRFRRACQPGASVKART